MAEAGRLIVLEGPDGVGKSTLAEAIASALVRRGIRNERLSFPGRDEGSLGRHIYELHHDPERFGIAHLTPESLQLLHIAAHLDAIASRIVPAIQAGSWVILDRYWWSTWAYGIVAGADRKTLDAMIDVERAAWRGIVPTPAFLIERNEPYRLEGTLARWREFARAYADLARAESHRSPVQVLQNDGPLEKVLRQAIAAIDGYRFRTGTSIATVERPARRGRGRPRSEPDLFSGIIGAPSQDGARNGPDSAVRATITVLSPVAPAKPTVVYETFWRFAAKRQDLFFRRIEQAYPLTDDPILARYKFTNAYRASDRVSQYLIRNVIYRHNQDPEEVFFRTMLFKLFNKIETWELLEERLGTPSRAGFDPERYAAVLDKAMHRGERIYSAAYIMPSGSGEFEDRRKHRSHLRLLEKMTEEHLALRIAECRSMQQAFEILRAHPMIGDFLAYQYVTDLNYGTICDFTEMEFVIPGPGARDGIRKCFTSLGGLDEAGIIRRMAEHQAEEFARFGVEFRSLWGRPLQLVDCQNLFCEVDKYARLAHPDVKGISGRTRIKQTYSPNPDPIEYWYPPKWGINDLVEETLRRSPGR
jgi:thymidylate kinase